MPPPRMPSARDDRRPSEPNSIAPLLPLSPRSDLSINIVPTTSTYPTPYPLPPTHATAINVTTPPPSITVSRQHSFSTGRSSESNSFSSPPPRQFDSSRSARSSPRSHVFNTTNPFSTFPRSRTLDPIRSLGGSPEDEEAGLGLEPPQRPGLRPRMMSFEDMLGGPPPGHERGDRSKRT